jgi:hypothetical protein
MNMALVEDSLVCPACGAGLNIYGLQRCCCCGVECYVETGKAWRTGEDMRLLQNWDAVLKEFAMGEPAGAQ